MDPWPDLQSEAYITVCGEGLRSNKTVAYNYNPRATIAPKGISYQAGYYHSSQCVHSKVRNL